MKSLFFTLMVFLAFITNAQQVEIPDYKILAKNPGANYYQLLADVRAKFKLKEQQRVSLAGSREKSQAFREEVAQFERWAIEWRNKIGADGKFPDPLTGWINAMQQSPDMFRSQQNLRTSNITTSPWTSIGPVTNPTLNGWTFGGGIGRVNVVKRHPANLGTLYAGTASGGLFRSTDLGTSWTPMTDQFSGLGVADFVYLPNNNQHMVMATGDFDGSHGNSIGIFKSTDGGTSWTPKLTFTLNQVRKIGHIYVDPDYGANNTLWATTTYDIYRSTDQGETWNSVYNNGGTNEAFNDFVKVGTSYFSSGQFGSLFKSTNGTTWNQVYTHPGANSRIDFAYSPVTPDILYILTSTNPAFAKYTISTGVMGAFTNVQNNNPGDNNAEFNTQQSYNQVIAVNPNNGNDLMIGEFSGKRSTDGGTNWLGHLNGYYETTGTSNWGGGYVHSDIHFIEYIGAAFDSLLVGNDGGVYVGPVSNTPFAYKECVNGLTCTQSYSLSIFDAEPNNVMIGNQDNDGRSRNYVASTATWYAAQAGDGIATAIHRTNKDIRFLTGTTGTLSYRTDSYVGNYSGKSITKPNNGIFDAPFEMHLANGNILYGGYSDVFKSTGITPSGDINAPDNANWVNLNSGLGDKPKIISLGNHPTDAAKQRIVTIGENNVIRKTIDETTWTTVAPPAGVIFNSIYWSRNTDTMIATVPAYAAANKVFFSPNGGGTWTNITDNMPNIAMVTNIRYEGTDTVFVATELGVYFARLNPVGGVLPGGWTKFGTGLPNVQVKDMEISYSKKQLFVASFGRGVWMANLNFIVVPISKVDFNYTTYGANQYSLTWKIDAGDVVKTILKKSTDARNFSEVESFTNSGRTYQPSYLVNKENKPVYYRLHYFNISGAGYYSNILAIRNDKGAMAITVYPNPTSGYVNISSNTVMDVVKIMTLSGAQVTYAKPQSNSYSFDMSLLPKGTYVVNVIDVNGVVHTAKVVNN